MQDIFSFAKQHVSLMLAVMVVLILLIILELLRQLKSARQINNHTATRLINHQNAVVIDIRSTDAFMKGHIVNAISLPSHDLTKSTKKLEKHKSNPIILICANGLESAKTANVLKRMGFNVFILQGGLRQWQDAGLPLIKD